MTSYFTIHSRVYAKNGNASRYKCIDCGKQAKDWCWIHGSDEEDINNYLPRCRACHIEYDGNSNKGSTNGRSKLTEEKVLNIRAMFSEGKYTKAHISRVFGVSVMTICNVVNRDTWRHI